MRTRKYSLEEVKTWAELLEQGTTLAQLSEELGIPKSSITTRLVNDGLMKTKPRVKSEPTPVVTTSTPVIREKTLADFTPREIIQYMYSLGYRIDKDGLYQEEIRKNRVKLSDII